MARPKNDGRGRIGGRQKGTPNKDKQLKLFLYQQSEDYFMPTIPIVDKDGNETEELESQFDKDMRQLKPNERVNAQLQLLSYHTPKMQATNVDLRTENSKSTITDRLEALANGEEIPSEEE